MRNAAAAWTTLVQGARQILPVPSRAMHKLCHYLLYVALTLTATVTPAAHADSIDDYVTAQMEKQHIPGLSLAVIKEGKVVKAKGYGWANVETKTPATTETVYKIASVSKQFIASGIMVLAQDGKLAVDDKVSKYLRGTPEIWKEITIRHLLTHTSGIPREAPGFDPMKVQPDADVIKTSYPLPLRFAPGEKWEYCNVGYFALAEIIYKVSGKPWGEFLAQRVFTPAGMTATRTTTSSEIVSNRAGGYTWTGSTLKNAENYLAVRPSGAFLSTVADLAKWDTALTTGSALSRSSLDQMWTPVMLKSDKTHPYGFGWSLDAYRGHKHFHHGGSLPGFRSEFARFPGDKLTVIVLTNLSSASPGSIANGVAALYIPALAASSAIP
jgi:D-alanyl-D-alanine carboxypeptidase